MILFTSLVISRCVPQGIRWLLIVSTLNGRLFDNGQRKELMAESQKMSDDGRLSQNDVK